MVMQHQNACLGSHLESLSATFDVVVLFAIQASRSINDLCCSQCWSPHCDGQCAPSEESFSGASMLVQKVNPLSLIPVSHMGASSSPGCNISNPVSYLWPGEAVDHSPETWCSVPK